MSMEMLTKALSADRGRGWYQEQRAYNQDNDVRTNPLEYFAWKAQDEYGLGPEDTELLRRERRMLQRFGVNEEREPYRAEKVRQYAFDSWFLEKYWTEHHMPWRGPESPTVEKAFTTNEVLGTFPIFYETAIQAGRLTNPILDAIVTDSVSINSGTASHVELTDTATTPSGAVETAEGARTAQVSITFRERTIPLKKFGYETLSSYEASRRARLPVLARGLERVGRRYQYLLTEYALDVAILGDAGTPANPAATYASAVAGTPVYNDWIELFFLFPQEYEARLFIGSVNVLKKMLNLAQFQDPLAGGAFQNQGRIPTPLGVPFLRWDSKGISSGYVNTKVLAVDTTAGLTEYTEGGILTEAERLISEGWSKVVTTQWVGFAKNDIDGFKVGTGFAT